MANKSAKRGQKAKLIPLKQPDKPILRLPITN